MNKLDGCLTILLSHIPIVFDGSGGLALVFPDDDKAWTFPQTILDRLEEKHESHA